MADRKLRFLTIELKFAAERQAPDSVLQRIRRKINHRRRKIRRKENKKKK